MLQKLVERIQKGEYIKMCKLLPVFWIVPKEGEESAVLKIAKSRGGGERWTFAPVCNVLQFM